MTAVRQIDVMLTSAPTKEKIITFKCWACDWSPTSDGVARSVVGRV